MAAEDEIKKKLTEESQNKNKTTDTTTADEVDQTTFNIGSENLKSDDNTVTAANLGGTYNANGTNNTNTTTTTDTSTTDTGTTGTTTTTLTAPSSTYDATTNALYQQALAALQAASQNTPTYTDSYGTQISDLYNQIVNRDKFTYDINSDMLYQQYVQQYQQKGQLAMMDTMGQAAALTGGYGSSYSQAVGQQQYDAYLQELNDIIPELYSMAYDQYQDEGDALYQQYAMLGDLSDTEYSRYQDQYNQWLTEREYAQTQADTEYERGYNQWLQQWDQYNTDREYQLSKENADREYELELAQFEWQKEQAAAAAAKSSSSGGGSYSTKTTTSTNTTSNTDYYDSLFGAVANAKGANETSSISNQIAVRKEAYSAIDSALKSGKITNEQAKKLKQVASEYHSSDSLYDRGPR